MSNFISIRRHDSDDDVVVVKIKSKNKVRIKLVSFILTNDRETGINDGKQSGYLFLILLYYDVDFKMICC